MSEDTHQQQEPSPRRPMTRREKRLREQRAQAGASALENTGSFPAALPTDDSSHENTHGVSTAGSLRFPHSPSSSISPEEDANFVDDRFPNEVTGDTGKFRRITLPTAEPTPISAGGSTSEGPIHLIPTSPRATTVTPQQSSRASALPDLDSTPTGENWPSRRARRHDEPPDVPANPVGPPEATPKSDPARKQNARWLIINIAVLTSLAATTAVAMGRWAGLRWLHVAVLALIVVGVCVIALWANHLLPRHVHETDEPTKDASSDPTT